MLAWLGACLLGCLTPVDDTCTTDQDCFKGQRCIEAKCAYDDAQDATVDTSTDSETSPKPDMNATLPACIVSPSAACQDDEPAPNNRRIDATALTSTRAGCFTDDDLRLFKTPSPVQGRVCPNDVDYYRVDYIECRAQALHIKATLRTVPICDVELPTLRAFINGKELSCTEDPQLTCRTLPNGALERVVSFAQTTHPSLGSIYFATGDLERDDVRYDYVLDVETSLGSLP